MWLLKGKADMSHRDPTSKRAVATVEREEQAEEPITPTERREAVRSIADDRVREARQEAAHEQAETENTARRNKAVKDAGVRAKKAVAARAELLPKFIEQLAAVTETANAMRAAKVAHVEAVNVARKHGGAVETVWPKLFGIDRLERDVFRTALTALQSVGGAC